MSTVELLGTSLVLLLAGAAVSLALGRYRVAAGWAAFGSALAGSVPLWWVVARGLAGTAGPGEDLAVIAGLGARLSVAVDPLSAFFLAIAATILPLATLFSIRYMTHFEHDSVAKFYPVLLAFYATVVAVLVVTDFLFFLVAWEAMTLTSFFLVIYERESAASQRAGLKYFLITHAATLCMVVGALLLWRRSGSFQFGALRDTLQVLLAQQPLLAHLVLLLFFLGFATKAGLLPMGDWLPDAHPAAPSGVSAALSGALVKLGVYGLVRVFVAFLPVSPASRAWGIALALAGTASLFVGTLTALRQHDSKRLMAFHTIGQIGYVCLGLGVGIACLGSNPSLAALGVIAGLFHAANHACFKACLFLGAGAVLYRTGERDMDRLGGLGRPMPFTAGSTTVASLSIAGVPPLNGFASKWLIIVTCILAGLQQPLFLLLALVALFISLATLASFLKVLAAVFLGPVPPGRSVAEVPVSMRVPQLVLAVLCVVLGVFPRLPMSVLRDVVAAVSPAAVPSAATLFGTGAGLTLTSAGVSLATWSPLAMLGGLALLAALAWAIGRSASAPAREVPVWTCGEEVAPAARAYVASSLYRPFKEAFRGVYPVIHVVPPHLPAALRRAFEVDGWLYGPVGRGLERAARGVSRTHVGIPQVYLLWVVVGAALVAAVLLALAH
ncbi:MAG: proton-conducting transporter membrane subunit [Acidobacteriota bacterium]